MTTTGQSDATTASAAGVISAADGAAAASAASPAELTKADRTARRAASLAFLAQGLCFGGVLSQVPAVRDRFGFTELELSLILLVVPVVAGVGSVLAGSLAQRLGSAWVLRCAGVAIGAMVALVGLSPTRMTFYLAVAGFGLALGVVDATMNMQGVAVQRRYGRSIIASCHGWWSVGGILGSLATSGTAQLDWTLAAAMGSVAAVAVLVSLSLGPFLLRGADQPVPDPAVPDSTGAPRPAGIRWRLVMLAGIAYLIMNIAESSTTNWSTVFLRDALDASHSVAPLGLAAYLACQLVGRMVADRVIRALGAGTTIVVSTVVAVIGFVAVVAATTPAMAVAGFSLAGVGLCTIGPLVFSAADAVDPRGRGLAIARVNLFNYAGFIIGAALVGVIAEFASLRLAFAIPGALVLVIAALAPAFRAVDSHRRLARLERQHLT